MSSCDTDVAYERFIQREKQLGRIGNYNLSQLKTNFFRAVEVSNRIDTACQINKIPIIRVQWNKINNNTAMQMLLEKMEAYCSEW